MSVEMNGTVFPFRALQAIVTRVADGAPGSCP